MISTIPEPLQQTGEITWPDFPLGMGTGRLCSLNGGLSVRRAARLLSQAFELGVRFIDTAPTYGQGHVECAIGRLAPAIHNQITICSKVGYSYGRKTNLINAAKPFVRPILPWANTLRRTIASARQRVNTTGSARLNIGPTSIRSVLESSLSRMGRDYLDLLLLHDPSVESIDNPANQDELMRLVKCGKIRSWGVSTSNPDVVERAVTTEGCSAVQIPVNRQWIDQNPGIVEKCVASGVSIIANSVFSALAQEHDSSSLQPRSAAAAAHLSYALRQPGVRMVLCGTRSLQHLSENVDSVRKSLPKSSTSSMLVGSN